MSIRQIALRLGIPLLPMGGLELVRHCDMKMLLTEVGNFPIIISGIEAFLLEGESVVPVMDLIGDYSGLPETRAGARAAVESALNLVEQRGRHSYFYDLSYHMLID